MSESPGRAKARHRQELRRSNAAAPHRNRAREGKYPGKGNRHNWKTRQDGQETAAMRSRTEYPLSTECHNCGNTFGEHCAANDGCPLPSYRGLHGGFSPTQTFINLEATPGVDKPCECSHNIFDHDWSKSAKTPGRCFHGHQPPEGKLTVACPCDDYQPQEG